MSNIKVVIERMMVAAIRSFMQQLVVDQQDFFAFATTGLGAGSAFTGAGTGMGSIFLGSAGGYFLTTSIGFTFGLCAS